jgi:hypothetical protein
MEGSSGQGAAGVCGRTYVTGAQRTLSLSRGGGGREVRSLTRSCVGGCGGTRPSGAGSGGEPSRVGLGR